MAQSRCTPFLSNRPAVYSRTRELVCVYSTRRIVKYVCNGAALAVIIIIIIIFVSQLYERFLITFDSTSNYGAGA